MNKEIFTVLPIPIDERVPEGYSLIVAYAKGDCVVVPISLIGLPDEQHNCDWEGCSSVEHVVRFFIKHKYDVEKNSGTIRVLQLSEGCFYTAPTITDADWVAMSSGLPKDDFSNFGSTGRPYLATIFYKDNALILSNVSKIFKEAKFVNVTINYLIEDNCDIEQEEQ